VLDKSIAEFIDDLFMNEDALNCKANLKLVNKDMVISHKSQSTNLPRI
jgi:hypothetical protein